MADEHWLDHHRSGLFRPEPASLWAGLAVVCMVLLTIGEMLNFPFANSYAMGRATGKTQGRYMAYYTMGFGITTILAPMVGLQIADHWGFRTLWNVIGAIAVVATVGTLWWEPWADQAGFNRGQSAGQCPQTGS